MSMDQTPTTPTSPNNNRPRPRSRGISFRSDKSGGSAGSPKDFESPREKAQRDSIWKGHSKANPNAAINEVQPGVANVTEESTLQNLRSFDHRDASGNVISDPDRANPTRPRMERPLDTIRSFERAIDDGYRRRTSYMRQDSESWDRENQFASRRSSYFGGYENGQGPGLQGPSPHRPVQSTGGGGYYGGQNYSYNGPPRARYAGNRMQSDPQLYGHRPYQQHGQQQSYDTVNTGVTNGSDSTGPWANSTDPSSENSSIDKVNAMNKPATPMDPYGGYGSNGHNGTILEEHTAGMYGEYWRAQENGQQGNYALREEYGHAQPNGYSQANGHSQPNGYNQPNLYAHPNGYGQSNGYSQPNGYAQPNGYGQPNGHSARDMYARSNSSPQLPQPSQARRPIQLGGNTSGDAVSRPPANLPPQTRKEPEKEKRQSWLRRRFSKKT